MKLWDDFLRRCHQCGAWGGGTDLFCESCWAGLLPHLDEVGPTGFSHRALANCHCLYRWEKKDKRLSQLIYSFKDGALPSGARRLARLLVGHPRFDSLFERVKPSVVVPAPSRRPGQTDHATAMAECLAQNLGLKFQNPLVRLPGDGEQKQRLQQQRNEVKMVARASVKGPILFVDDVITTGATVRAAFKALGCPKGFMVCALARRPRYQ